MYFGYEEQNELPDFISNRMRGQFEDRDRDSRKEMMNMQTKSSTYAREYEEFGGSSMLEELEKYFEKEEKEQEMYYLKKSKLEPTVQ